MVFWRISFLTMPVFAERHEQLVCAALTELKYENMKDQIKKVFSDHIYFFVIVQDEESIKVELS